MHLENWTPAIKAVQPIINQNHPTRQYFAIVLKERTSFFSAGGSKHSYFFSFLSALFFLLESFFSFCRANRGSFCSSVNRSILGIALEAAASIYYYLCTPTESVLPPFGLSYYTCACYFPEHAQAFSAFPSSPKPHSRHNPPGCGLGFPAALQQVHSQHYPSCFCGVPLLGLHMRSPHLQT